MRVTLKVLLAAAVVLLAYMCYRSIMEPIEFDKERTARESAIEKRLIDIRTAQIEYKNRNGRHAGSFEELAKFLNESKLPFVIKEGVLTDEQLEKGLTEKKAAEIVRRARQTGNNEEVIRNGLRTVFIVRPHPTHRALQTKLLYLPYAFYPAHRTEERRHSASASE